MTSILKGVGPSVRLWEQRSSWASDSMVRKKNGELEMINQWNMLGIFSETEPVHSLVICD